MSITWGLSAPVAPDVERWLGREFAPCDLCERVSAALSTQSGWSCSLGESLDVSLCPACGGRDDG